MARPTQTTGSKTCTNCGVTKDITEFYKRGGKQSPDSRKNHCKQCDIARVRKRHQDNPERTKNNDLKRLYGITLNEYNEMLEEQDHKCATCSTTDPGGKHGKFMVDHDHKTGKVRGLLCKNCNIALGLVNDDTDLIQKMINYLSTNTH